MICTFTYSFFSLQLFFLWGNLRTTLGLCILWTWDHSVCKFHGKSYLAWVTLFSWTLSTFFLCDFAKILKKLLVFFKHFLIYFIFLNFFLVFDLILIITFKNWSLTNTLHQKIRFGQTRLKKTLVKIADLQVIFNLFT